MKRSSFILTVKDGAFHFKSDKHKNMFKGWLQNDWDEQEVRVELSKVTSQRSSQQNKALHVYFQLLADELNAGGYTVQLVLKEKIDLDWDSTKVKELLWRPAQQAILGKKSTVDLRKTSEIDQVYDHLVRHMGEKFGITVPFPSEEDSQLVSIN